MNRSYNSICEALIGLERSSELHLKWILKILLIVSFGGRGNYCYDVFNDKSYDSCDFGRWINGYLKVSTSDYHFLVDIHRKHMDMHLLCNEMLCVQDEVGINQSCLQNFEAALLGFNEAVNSYKSYLLELRASYDSLTGVPLRRVLDQSYDRLVTHHSDKGMYLLLIDVDNFKKINDFYGHLIGDSVLHSLAMLLDKGVRKSEPLYRYGGEEFIILIYAQHEEEACAIAERLRSHVSNTNILAEGKNISITVTTGVTRVNKGEPLSQVIERADIALYLGKQSGRNCCVYIDENRKSRML